MSTINQIQLPNGSIYDFEDTAAREEASSKADKTLATTSADGLMSAADKSKLDGIGAGSNVKSVNGKTGAVSLSKADVGLSNVDNTSDVDKPYYKLIGQTETNTNKVGHFHFNDASRSLYKIKNFYAASGEGDLFYLLHKKSDYTITATKHFSNVRALFTANLAEDCTVATNLISESDPAILTIVRNRRITATDVLTLIFYEHQMYETGASLNHWKLEVMASGGSDPNYTKHWEDGDWITVFERTNVSDHINRLWCGLNPYYDDGLNYIWIKGIRITIYAATPCSTKSWEFGYNQLRIAGMRLLGSGCEFSPAEALGALDVAGGTVYGKTTFQEGISAASYSGATATSSTDGLMSKADKAKLDTLIDKLYPVGSIYLSVNDTDPGTFIGGTWIPIKDRFLLAAGNIYAHSAGSTGGEAQHTHKYGIQYGGYYRNISLESDENAGVLQGGTGNPTGSVQSGANITGHINANTTQASKDQTMTYYKSTADTSSASNIPPYFAVYVWLRIDPSFDD